MKTVVLFGATGGLGSKLAPLLQQNYNTICVGSKDVDVTDYSAVKGFFDRYDVDVVVNLSGYNYDMFLHKCNNDTYVEINKQIDINIKGTINIVSTCLNHMRSKGFGSIILTSSILADHPVISTSIYAGCKGFIDSLAKTVAIENASKGINCNTLQLGYFDGGLTYKIPQEFRESIKNTIPAKRWGEIKELFYTVDYLIKTPYITGQSINISGGVI